MSFPISHKHDTDLFEHWRRWHALVDAGRIGERPAIPAEIALRQMANEEVLLGRSRSVRVNSALRGRG